MVQGRAFQFIREIASGGFGSVYLAEVARPDGTSRRVAVKLLHPKWSEDDEIASRMRDEARLLARLRHPNIVEVLDLTRLDGRSAVIMEFLEAVDLNMIAVWATETGQRVPLRVALEITALVASALDAAYNAAPSQGAAPLRVIHRDIKPSNIMVDGRGRVKVLDFGTARAEFDSRESKTQEIAFGSLEYMPPERLFFEPETSNSDVYSLAATLFELLALEKLGKARLRPADHEKFVKERFDDLLLRYPMPSEEVEDILHELMMDMLAFEEAARPTAADVASRLTSFAKQVSGRPLNAWSDEVIPPLVRRTQKAMDQRPRDALVGSVLHEDAVSAGFGLTGGFPKPAARAPAAAVFEDRPAPVPVLEVDEEDEWDAGPTARVELDANGNPIERPIHVPAPVAPPPVTPMSTFPDGWTGSAAPIAESAPPASAPASGGSSAGLWIGLAAALLFGGIGFLGLFGVAGAAAWFHAQDPSLGPGAPAPASQPAPAAAAEPAPVAVPTGPSSTFTSRLAGTKKVQVRCTGGQADGEAEAVVAGEALGECTVIAINQARERRTAVVKDVKTGAYTCFEGDSQECIAGASP